MRQNHVRFVLFFLVVSSLGLVQPGAGHGQALDLSIKGSVSVTLGPAEAVAAGAAFGIDALPLEGSGAIESGLEPGRHAVRFQPLPGWIEPAGTSILVVGGTTREAAFEYQPLPAYYFKGIPPQTAHPETPLRFLVLSSDAADPQSPAPGTQLTASFSPQPSGAISFDPSSGELRYDVDPEDRRDFTVTFHAVGPTGPVDGTVVISPAPALPPEDAVLHFDRPMPDPLSKDYIQIREEKSANPETFNLHENVHPRKVSVSGRRLIFEAASTQSDLHTRYNGDEDLRELQLFAESVVIRSPLKLPGTRVVIHARELRFEGKGALDVSPPDWFAGKPDPVTPDGTFAKSGASGLSSPPVEVHVETFHSDPDPSSPGAPPKRFILRGAGAQDAGEGRDGRDILRPGTVLCGSFNGLPIIYTGCILPDGSRDNECGSEFVSGEDAVPAGTPGRGGAGGTFTSPFGQEMSPLLSLEGGADGRKGADHIGGAIGGLFVIETFRSAANGEPCAIAGHKSVVASRGFAGPAPGVPCECVDMRQKDPEQIAQECAAFAEAEVADCVANCEGSPRICANGCRLQGIEVETECNADPGSYVGTQFCAELRCTSSPGKVVQSTDPGAWLHPLLVRSTLLFVKDAYLNERVPEARAILEEYGSLIASLKSNLPPGDEADQFFQLGEEIESLLHRMDANLDYFGNPVTWVPLLSFEANLAAFTEEVDRAIPALYLGYWVKAAAQGATRTRDAAIAAKEKLDGEIDTLILDHALAQEEMPILLAEADDLEAKVAAVTAKLAALEVELQQRAQENANDRHKLPLWKKAIGVLGGATKVIPLGQPALGFVGVGLGLLSRFNPDKPLENLSKLPDLIKAVKKNPYALCAKGKAQQSKTDPKQEKKPTLMDRAEACKTLLQAGVKDIREALKDTKADKKEVDAELEKLRASDPIFLETTKEVAQLNAEKQRLGERIASTLDRLTKFASAVNENVNAITQLDRDLEAALDVIDHSSILYIADMARRTTDRLLSYQYLMAKAYQFRTLKPYTGDLRLGRVLERVRALVDAQDSKPVLSPDEFNSLKAIYEDEVGRIAKELLDDLNLNGPEHSAPVSFRLTAEEVATLNEQGSLEIDLAKKGLFGANEEDLRIASIETRDLDARVIGTIGTTATLRLKYAHSGFSRIARNGQTYLFTHYRTERVNPITWTTVYDALSGTKSEVEISTATESLLRYLLGLSDAEDILLYSPPGAMSKLVLTKEVTADNGVKIDVQGLTVTLRYDFAQGSSGVRRLDVQVSDDLGPRILLDREDQNGRRDGLGEFLRAFTGPETVRVEAPPAHGIWAFDHWEVSGGNGSGGAVLDTPVIDVTMTGNISARAVFRSTAAPVGERFLRGDSSGDGNVDLTDAVRVLGHLFLGDAAPSCPDAADADDNGALEITDAIRILGYLFLGDAEPPAPGTTTCGVDPTVDGLGPCVSEVCE